MIQTKDSNLTFRPLTIDDAEQYNALLRYAFQVTEQELSESGWKDDEIKQSKFPVLVRADVLGCFCEEDLVSQFAVYPLDMNIYGVRYPVGFVTSVCTYPEYTGQGIMKKADDPESHAHAGKPPFLCASLSLLYSALPESRMGNHFQ